VTVDFTGGSVQSGSTAVEITAAVSESDQKAILEALNNASAPQGVMYIPGEGAENASALYIGAAETAEAGYVAADNGAAVVVKESTSLDDIVTIIQDQTKPETTEKYQGGR
jgi:hypothetical protein